MTRRIVFDKILHEKPSNFAKNSKYHGYQWGLASVVYKFFDKKTSGGVFEKENISNKEFLEELHKPIIRNLEEKKSTLIFYRQNLGA